MLGRHTLSSAASVFSSIGSLVANTHLWVASTLLVLTGLATAQATTSLRGTVTDPSGSGFGPNSWASPVYCQSVGQFWPTSTLSGKPEIQRPTPRGSQPPNTALATGPALTPKRRPRP